MWSLNPKIAAANTIFIIILSLFFEEIIEAYHEPKCIILPLKNPQEGQKWELRERLTGSDAVQVGLAQWLEGPSAAELPEVPVKIAGSYWIRILGIEPKLCL